MSNDLPNIGKILEYYGATVRSSTGPQKCPFHNDQHASAGIDYKNNLFNCLACGVGGNSLQIIAQREGVNIGDAVAIAEGITGESHSELRGEYSSGARLPRKQGNNPSGSTGGTIRRSFNP